MIPHLLLLDNYDSFTYNLWQGLSELGARVTVRRNREITCKEAQAMKLDGIVFSPGAGTVKDPYDVGEGPALYKMFREKVPILGVCLGHQMIGDLLGHSILKVPAQHGRRWPVKVLDKSGLMAGVDDEITAMRYHSYVVGENPQSGFTVTARTNDEDQFIMAMENKDQKIFGTQFHPESIGTKSGQVIFQNFLNFCTKD